MVEEGGVGESCRAGSGQHAFARTDQALPDGILAEKKKEPLEHGVGAYFT